MVALSGRGWRLAPSLAAMVRDADRIAPRRSERSDGSIGDWSHRLRRSHHNPSGGYVDAVDLTHDPKGGFDAHARARQVAARRDPRIEQIISNRQQWKHGKGWHRYWSLGLNPHISHVHFGVKRNAAGRVGTAGWWSGAPVPQPAPPPSSPQPKPPEEDDDMFTYEYDANGAAPNILVLVAGRKRVRLTGAELLARRQRATETHLGPVDADEEARFLVAFGPIIT